MTTGNGQGGDKPNSSRAEALLNNENNLRHGLRGSHLPKPYRYVQKSINRFRLDLENVVLAARGEISLESAALINTAFRWERAAQIFQAMLRGMQDAKGRELTTDQIIACAEKSAKCSECRDRAIRLLNIGPADRDPWAVLDTRSVRTAPAALPSPQRSTPSNADSHEANGTP